MEMLQLQLMIFIVIAIGYWLGKKQMLCASTRKQLTDLVINLVLPCTIIKSFMMEVTGEILRSTGVILLISLGIQLFYLAVNPFLYRRFPNSKALIMKYSTIVSNAGFMGLPICEAVFGAEGLLYGSIALIPLRIFMWSSGLSLFTSTTKKAVIKNLLTHPCIIAVWIGFAFMGLVSFHVPIPGFLTTTIQTIASCNTFLSMLVIGAILSGVGTNELKDPAVFYYSFLRLLAIPLLVFAVLRLLGIDPVVTGVSVLITAMPAGSTTAMLAEKYHQDAQFASKLVFLSTVLSLVTLPVISLILQ